MTPSVKRHKKAGSLPGLEDYSELLVKAALAEDIGSGDITTDSVVPGSARGTGEFIAREDMVVAGLFIAKKTFRLLDGSSAFKAAGLRPFSPESAWRSTSSRGSQA